VTPSSWPPSNRQLMTVSECVAFDPRDRPGIAEVAARLREMRAAAWMSAGVVLELSRRLVRLRASFRVVSDDNPIIVLLGLSCN
jgi:hypothetical protein